MREQVCLYMCPWPRIQAALTDEHALNVTYRYDRGEPRASVKKATALRAQGLPAGDCVDCLQCVHVCPTGVDIRNGPESRLHPVRAVHRRLRCRDGQSRPADAADRLRHRPRHPASGRKASRAIHRFVRLRTALYAAIIALVGGMMTFTLATRSAQAISVIHDRNPVFVRLSDGAIRNAYTVRISNKRAETARVHAQHLGSRRLAARRGADARRRPLRGRCRPGPDARGARAGHRLCRHAAGFDADQFPSLRCMTGERASAGDYFRAPAGG